jgi:hypothetical protein
MSDTAEADWAETAEERCSGRPAAGRRPRLEQPPGRPAPPRRRPVPRRRGAAVPQRRARPAPWPPAATCGSPWPSWPGWTRPRSRSASASPAAWRPRWRPPRRRPRLPAPGRLPRPAQNLSLGARLLWEAADAIWRWAGDTATDENHYTKRLILSGVIASPPRRLTSAAKRPGRTRRASTRHGLRKVEGGLPAMAWATARGALARWRYGELSARSLSSRKRRRCIGTRRGLSLRGPDPAAGGHTRWGEAPGPLAFGAGTDLGGSARLRSLGRDDSVSSAA